MIPRVRTRLGFAQGHRGDGAELRLDPGLPASLEPGGAVLTQEQLAGLRPLFRKHLALLQQPVAGAGGVTQTVTGARHLHARSRLRNVRARPSHKFSAVSLMSTCSAPTCGAPGSGSAATARSPPPRRPPVRSGGGWGQSPALISASLLLSLSASSLCDLPRWPGPPKLLHPLPHTSRVQHPRAHLPTVIRTCSSLKAWLGALHHTAINTEREGRSISSSFPRYRDTNKINGSL